MKKLIASLLVSLAILTGGAVAANASTTYRSTYTGCIGHDLYYRYLVTVDYDWFEEVFQGKHDYSYWQWGSLIQRNANQCGTIYV